MPLEKEQVEHIARLARLNLSPKEIEKFTRELAVIVDYFEQLKDVDTTGIELQTRLVKAANVFREDKVTSSLPREKVLSNAPESDGEYFLVPKVIG